MTVEATSGKFSPSGLILIGLSTGMVHIMSFNCFSKSLETLRLLDCRNKRGPKSSGRKITGFDFVGDLCLISSNDSRIRLFDLESFEIRQKYKGLKNESSKIAASVGGNGKYVISGSENGGAFIWNLTSLTVPKLNPVFTKKKRYKNSTYEVINVDKQKTTSTAKFAPDKLVETVQRRYNSSKQGVSIQSVIIIAQKGVLSVFYNKVLLTRKNSTLNKSFN
jgi:WD40 repeat protein